MNKTILECEKLNKKLYKLKNKLKKELLHDILLSFKYENVRPHDKLPYIYFVDRKTNDNIYNISKFLIDDGGRFIDYVSLYFDEIVDYKICIETWSDTEVCLKINPAYAIPYLLDNLDALLEVFKHKD